MKIAIAGGDLRMIYACRSFIDAGYDCFCFGFGKEVCERHKIAVSDSLKDAKVIILPPKSANGIFLNAPLADSKITLEDVIRSADKDALFLGGSGIEAKNHVNYSERDDFQLFNAVPTSEGAVALAMNELETTLYGARAVIIGFGRIGSYLAKILKSLGAKITIVARSPKSRAQAEISGFAAVGFDKFEAPLSAADIVFNTVPFKIIGTKELEALKTGTAIIDLASFPGGETEEECESCGIRLIRALGLPGRVAPKTAGEIIFKTALSIFHDWGITQ